MTQSWFVMPGRPKPGSKLALQNLWIPWLSAAVMVIELWKISILDYIMETCMHRAYFVYLGSWMWKYKAERATVPDSLKSFGCSLSYPHYSIAASHVAHLETWVSMVVCVFCQADIFRMIINQSILGDRFALSYSCGAKEKVEWLLLSLNMTKE